MMQSCSRCGTLHPAGAPCLALTLPTTAASDQLQPNTMLAGRYRITRTIHRGGMSVVYEADDTLLEIPVALKELRLPDGASAEELREAEAWFARESFLLSALRQPLIPTFYSVFREAERSYIVQEYVEGENLDQVVARRGPFDEPQVIEAGLALCGLLTYLHEQGKGTPGGCPVIFRDLKPANIMLRAGAGRLAVVDFGIARHFTPTAVGTVVGTPGYAPPEQYQGLATPQSDIYALGATLHRLLTGYDPEQGTPFTFPHVRDLNPLVSPELAAIVERAVRLNPAERYSSAEEMGWALRRLESPVGAALASSFSSRGKKSARRTWLILTALLLVPGVLSRGFDTASHDNSVPQFMNTGSVDGGQLLFAQGDSSCQPDVETSIVPAASIVADTNNTLWFVQADKIDQLSPSGQITACTLPAAAADNGPQDLAAGPDNNIWFTESNAANIGRISPQGDVVEFPIASNNLATKITAGPDGAMWFTEQQGNAIGRISSDGVAIDEYRLPTADSQPIGITAGPDNNIWFTEQRANAIGRISPDGVVTTFPLPGTGNQGPTGITAGPDGNLWFTELGGNAIGRISPDGQIVEFPLPTRYDEPLNITTGPDNSLWFTESVGNRIGRIDMDGQITEYPLPTLYSEPQSIAAGADGNLWFTELFGAKLGRVTLSGAVSEFPADTEGWSMNDGANFGSPPQR